MSMASDLAIACDPVRLAERAGLAPDPWQADVLHSSASRLLLNCSRQSGKSTVTSVLAVHTALYDPGALVLLLSPSLRQSQELFRKCLDTYRAVNRPVSDADRTNMRDQTIEVTETSEEPVITKRARVVEEVSIGKETTERTETVHDKVRRTDVKVEKLGAEGRGAEGRGRNTGDYDTEFRRDFETRYAPQGGKYESYAPAYQYGYTMAGDQRYANKSWGDIESNLKTDYLRNNPNSTWDEAKGAVRYGWEKVTGKRSAAG